MDVITLSMLGLTLIHVSERVLCYNVENSIQVVKGLTKVLSFDPYFVARRQSHAIRAVDGLIIYLNSMNTSV